MSTISDRRSKRRSRTPSYSLIRGEGTGSCLALGHRQVHHLLEQFLRIFGVESPADLVDQLRARDGAG